jgi:hypothetical protein
VQEYCIARQATDDNVALGIAYWIPKATNTHSEYVLPATATLVVQTCLSVMLNFFYYLLHDFQVETHLGI